MQKAVKSPRETSVNNEKIRDSNLKESVSKSYNTQSKKDDG
jgi:hypothetical protein